MKTITITAIALCMTFFCTAQTFKDAFDTWETTYNSGNGLATNDNLQGSLAWGEGYERMGFMTMYRATDDPYYLTRVVDRSLMVIDRRDDNIGYVDHLGRSRETWVAEKYSDNNERYAWVVHSGMITYPMADFVQTVYNDPTLHGIPHTANGTTKTLKDWADDLYTAVEATIQAHDNQWQSDGYHTENVNFLGSLSNAQLLPYNQGIAMGRTLLMMWRADPLNNSSYLFKVITLANEFDDALTLQSNDSYVWNYSTTHGTEDISHGVIEADFARLCYLNGIVFDRDDMVRFANTFKRNIYEEPLLLDHNVAGTGSTLGAFTTAENGHSSDLNSGIMPTALAQIFTNEGYSLGSNYSFKSIQTNSKWTIFRPDVFRYYVIEKDGNDLDVKFYNAYILSAGQWVVFAPYNHDIFHICSDVFTDLALYTSSSNGYRLSALANMYYYQHLLDPVALYRGLGSGSQLAGLSCGDYDNDGTDEMVLLRNFDGNIYMYELNSNDKFTSVSSYTSFGSNSQWVDVASGDFDPSHPGDEFVAFRNFDGNFYLFGLVGGQITVLDQYTNFGSASAWAGVAGGDFDPSKPGDEFVALRNFDANIFLMDYNENSNTFSTLATVSTFGSASAWAGVAAEDFDGDNVDEFVAVRNFDGNFYMMEYQSGSIVSVATNTAPGPASAWVDITAGDFDNDNIPEFTAHRNFDGDFYFYQLIGSNIILKNREYHPQNTHKGPIASGKVHSPTQGGDNIVMGRNHDGDLFVFQMEDLFKPEVQKRCLGGGHTTYSDHAIHTLTAWSDDKANIAGNLVIRANAELRLSNMELYMQPGSQIIVEKGARLDINSSKIHGCGQSIWKGIEVLGDEKMLQSHADQGVLTITNSTIADAQYAVALGDRDDDTHEWITGFGGGKLSASGVTFSRNGSSISFSPYSAESSASTIVNCTFDALETDLGHSGSLIQLDLSGMKGISVTGSSFSGADQAVYAAGTENIRLTANEFSQNTQAIAFEEGYMNDVSSNGFEGDREPVVFRSQSSGSVSGNSMANTETGILVESGSDIDVQNNSMNQGTTGIAVNSTTDIDLLNNHLQNQNTGIQITNCESSNSKISDNIVDQGETALSVDGSDLAAWVIHCNNLLNFNMYGVNSTNSDLPDMGDANVGAGIKFVSNSQEQPDFISHSGAAFNFYYDPVYAADMSRDRFSSKVNSIMAAADASCSPGTYKKAIADVEEAETKSSIFPNPARDRFLVDFGYDSGDKPIEVEIFNSAGILLYQSSASGSQLEISEKFPSGMYIITVSHSGRIDTHRLIIE